MTVDSQLAYLIFCRLLIEVEDKAKGEVRHELENGSVILIQIEVIQATRLVLIKDDEAS